MVFLDPRFGWSSEIGLSTFVNEIQGSIPESPFLCGCSLVFTSCVLRLPNSSLSVLLLLSYAFLASRCFFAVWDLRDRCSFFLLWRIFCSFCRCSFFLLLRILRSFAVEAERKGDKELKFLRPSISVGVMATSSLALHNVSCFSAEHINAGMPRIQSSRRVLVCPHLATPPPAPAAISL